MSNIVKWDTLFSPSTGRMRDRLIVTERVVRRLIITWLVRRQEVVRLTERLAALRHKGDHQAIQVSDHCWHTPC